jgi:excisionase family DNA binding protein
MSRLPDGQAGQLQMILRATQRSRLPSTNIKHRKLKALAGCLLTTLFFLIFLAFWKSCISAQVSRMELLTTSEAARYLRLKERKIYEMVAEGTVPCTKVTGRWLFPKAELDHWLASSITRPAGMTHADVPPIVGGSHDPLLEWALRESGSGLASLAVGSEAGLTRFCAGEAMAAAIHLHALNESEDDANLAAMKSRSDLQDAVMIAFCRREEGFLLTPRNPLKIRTIEDVVAKRARIAMRPQGAGAQLLLLRLLHAAKTEFDRLAAVQPVCPTGPDVAQAIRAGRADTGIATRSVANSAGLEFAPIVWERFDLVMRQRDYFHPPLQALIRFLRSDEMAARAREIGGFDLSDTGKVRFVI